MQLYLLSTFEPDYTDENAMVLIQHTEIFKPTANTHYHDYYEIILVESGDAIHDINGTRTVVCTGTLALIRPEDHHCVYSYKSGSYLMYNIRYTPETFLRAAAFAGMDPALLTAPALPVSVRLSTDQLARYAARLHELADMPPSALRGAFIRRYMLEVILELVSARNVPGTMPAWMSSLLSRLDDVRHVEELDVPGLARMAGMSPEHLSRSFRRYLGVTPSKYLNFLRMRLAARLIEEGLDDIMEISLRCGYNNLSWFYRNFREFYRKSPGEYIMARHQPPGEYQETRGHET